MSVENTEGEVQDLVIRGLEWGRRWDWENAYYWFSEPARLGKLLAHFEIYKKIIELPGDVCEFGVFKATSLIRLATFRRMLENDDSRVIMAFDAFGSFPREKIALDADQSFIDRFEESAGDGLSKAEVSSIMVRKGFGNIDLREGNVFDTVPQFLTEKPHARIALLHLDMDVGEPTQFALDELYDRVVPGGVIMFDDYNSVAGASDVADALCAKHGLRLRKVPFHTVPSYLVKP